MIAFVLLTLAFTPIAAAMSWHICGKAATNYTANSPYHANLELLSTALSNNASTNRYLFAMGSVGAAPDTVYGLALCRGDVNAAVCRACVVGAFRAAQQRCAHREDVTIFCPSCRLRFSGKDFLRPDVSCTAAVRAQGRRGRQRLLSGALLDGAVRAGFDTQGLLLVPRGHIRKVLIIALVVSLLALFLCFIKVSFIFMRSHGKGNGRREEAKMNVKEDESLPWGVDGASSEFMIYDFSQVLEATANFSEKNKLGQGGYGPVYKGQLPDGLEIAVKRLASHSGQGFIEFRNEVQLIAKLQHSNLVRLMGCCNQGEEKILIYEYLPNKSLDFLIFDETRRASLDWNRRVTIIEGISQGLVYLHKHSRLRIIHRDLKASNILLDKEMNPKISDSGLAKIFSTHDAERSTNRIIGTYGYMAPEYASQGIFSIKSDVFSFGVLMLEVVSGKRSSCFHGYGDFINLLGHAWQLWKDRLWLHLADPSLDTEYHSVDIMRCINIALLCVQENAADRPTMSEVVAMLSSKSMTLPEPKHPAYFQIRIKDEDSEGVGPSSVKLTVSALDGR
ncbi:unnamed protein product [Urochloa decumbens]|uniref:Cysteine-rich receptor-like protein kinase 10 n=1 Tax=Urochloa decumbens TaxID=240449 RepID=A0ABC9AZP0_9POAL